MSNCPAYKLSNKAAEDFAQIYEYTYLNFGEQQADDYADGMDKCLLMLASSPQIGRKTDEFKMGIYRHDHQHHAIFYRIDKKFIFISRILHQQMNPLLHIG